jgi:hypothetical protein
MYIEINSSCPSALLTELVGVGAGKKKQHALPQVQ